MAETEVVTGDLHPETDVGAFDRYLLYKVAERVGLLPEGFTLGEDPNLVNVVASNEQAQTETPEEQAAASSKAFQDAVAAEVAKQIASQSPPAPEPAPADEPPASPPAETGGSF